MSELSLPFVLPALAMRLLVVEDLESLEQITSKGLKREVAPFKLAVKVGRGKHRLVSLRFLRKSPPDGGRARMQKMTAKQRSEHGKRMAKARWSKPRVVEVKGPL